MELTLAPVKLEAEDPVGVVEEPPSRLMLPSLPVVELPALPFDGPEPLLAPPIDEAGDLEMLALLASESVDVDEMTSVDVKVWVPAVSVVVPVTTTVTGPELGVVVGEPEGTEDPKFRPWFS